MKRTFISFRTLVTLSLAPFAFGCSGEVVGPEGSENGAGGATSTADTASASSSWGSFGGGGTGPGCGECAPGEGCVDGACVPVPATLIVTVAETKEGDGMGEEIAGADALLCGYDTSGGSPAEQAPGTCVLVPGNQPPPALVALGGTGGVTIEVANVGKVAVPAPDAGDACIRVPFESPVLLLGGTYATFAGTGGASFPAFNADVRVPSALQLGAGSLDRGSPFSIDWSGTGEAPIVLLVGTLGSSDDPYIACLVDDIGHLTIDGALTALLADNTAPGFVLGARSETVIASAPFAPQEIRASVQRTDLLIVDYNAF